MACVESRLKAVSATGTAIEQTTQDYDVSWSCLEESVDYEEHSISVPEFNNLDYNLASSLIGYELITPVYPSTSLATPANSQPYMPQLEPASVNSERFQSSPAWKKPRRTLSDDERRQICSYYEEHRATHAAIGSRLYTSDNLNNPINVLTDLSI